MPTTTTDRDILHRTPNWLAYGIMAFGLATALSAVGVFAGEHDQDQIEAFPALVVFFGIMTGLVFAFAVRPAAVKGASPRRVAALGGAALLSLPVFWTGLPTILGLAALKARTYAPASRSTTSGTLLATVALAASVVLAFVG